MEWSKLATARRYSDKDKTVAHPKRPEFQSHERDIDRILFSSSFRRLQGKTQVYIFPHTDYVRNRLTHSLEVGSIGKALCKRIFRSLEEKISKELPEGVTVNCLSDIVVASCYAHDIGNPPFGHIGEYAIHSWFKDMLQENIGPKLASTVVNGENANDFLYFDGNAQSFRLMSKLQGWGKGKGGLQLTYATLGSMIKYPYSSKRAGENKAKFGYYFDDKEAAHAVLKETGQSNVESMACARHPLAYIMEAADDIAYLTADIEDASKMKLISKNTAEDGLHEIAKLVADWQLDKPYSRAGQIRKNSQDRIKYIRSAAIVALIEKCSDAFVANYSTIMAYDNFSRKKHLFEFLTKSEQQILKDAKNISKRHVYTHEYKVSKEAGAYEIIRYLLDRFAEVVENCSNGRTEPNMNERARNLRRIIQPKYDLDAKGEYTEEHEPFSENPYQGYIRLVDFVSGMTDRYAYELYQKISGARLHAGGGLL